MTITSHPNFLRYVLWSDVIASGATGLLMIAAAGGLESFLGLPSTLTREAGLILVPYVAFVASSPTWAARRVPPCTSTLRPFFQILLELRPDFRPLAPDWRHQLRMIADEGGWMETS